MFSCTVELVSCGTKLSFVSVVSFSRNLFNNSSGLGSIMNNTGRVYGTRSTSARPPVAHSPLRRDLSGSSTTVLRSPIATSPIIRVPPPPSSLSVVVVDVSRDDGASSSSAGLVDIGGLTALPTTSSSPEVLSNSREPLASPADMVQSIYDISWAILANPDNWNVGVTLADFQRTGVRRACDLQDLDFDPSCHEPFYVVFQQLLTMLGLRRFYRSINPTFRSPAPEAQVSSPVVLPPPPASHPLPLDPPANPQPPRSRGKTSVILTNGGAPADPLAVPFSYHAPRVFSALKTQNSKLQNATQKFSKRDSFLQTCQFF